jgi:pimeloyl-ACP methyl ester carboxylesterase/predicted ester cyclase
VNALPDHGHWIAPRSQPEDLPLLLIPGTLCDQSVFEPLLERLDASTIVHAPLEGGTDIVAVAQGILDSAPPRFALLGFSLGGIVALEIARRAAERVMGLALIGSNARAVPRNLHAERRAAARIEDGQTLTDVIDRLWLTYVSPASLPNAKLRRRITAMAGAAGPGALATHTEIALSRSDTRDQLGEFAMPALVVAGSEDVINPPDLQLEIAERLPNASLALVPEAGHFVLLEQPDAVAAHVAAWLERAKAFVGTDPAMLSPTLSNSGGSMNEQSGKGMSPTPKNAKPQPEGDSGAVLQVERRDFTQLVPNDRPRVQSMRGFDADYTDIVDYIIRCTHRIWDERDVGLIYTHYTHNCVAYTTLGTMYDRETHIRDTIQRLVEFPDRRGQAIQVIWRGNDVDGFYTSHMTHGLGRHTEFGAWGKPTGRTFCTRTVAECMILENKIYKEWIVRDNMGPLIQVGVDPQVFATGIAKAKLERGETVLEISENRRLLGQYQPEAQADISIAHDDGESELLEWLHHIYNKRMFGKIHEIYAPNCQWHGPLMRELYGVAAVLQQTMRLVALMPDCAFVPQHICSVDSEEGGRKYAVRWMLDGHHLGYGSLGAPTGHKLSVMGVTHFHIRDGKIIDEWVVYDELSMLVQLKMAALQGS